MKVIFKFSVNLYNKYSSLRIYSLYKMSFRLKFYNKIYFRKILMFLKSASKFRECKSWLRNPLNLLKF
jgi:hypothetical protein